MHCYLTHYLDDWAGPNDPANDFSVGRAHMYQIAFGGVANGAAFSGDAKTGPLSDQTDDLAIFHNFLGTQHTAL